MSQTLAPADVAHYYQRLAELSTLPFWQLPEITEPSGPTDPRFPAVRLSQRDRSAASQCADAASNRGCQDATARHRSRSMHAREPAQLAEGPAPSRFRISWAGQPWGAPGLVMNGGQTMFLDCVAWLDQ
jgi:hypothetical protein